MKYAVTVTVEIECDDNMPEAAVYDDLWDLYGDRFTIDDVNLRVSSEDVHREAAE